jgi:hypothetical protein
MAAIDGQKANNYGSTETLIQELKKTDRIESRVQAELVRKLERVSRFESIQSDNSRMLCCLTPVQLIVLALARAVLSKIVVTLDLDKAELNKEDCHRVLQKIADWKVSAVVISSKIERLPPG